jgi:predicted nucleotidyltransferase
MEIREKTNLRKKLFKILSKTYNSENIFIFGSHAYGTLDENIDLDIAIIVKESDLPQYKRSRKGIQRSEVLVFL